MSQLNRVRSRRTCCIGVLWYYPRDVMLREFKGYCLQHLLVLLKGCTHRVFHGGDMHVQMLLQEDLCNQLSDFGALVIQEEAPSPLPVCCPTDDLLKLTRQHYVMVTPGYRLLLLLFAADVSSLPGGPFSLGILHQDRM